MRSLENPVLFLSLSIYMDKYQKLYIYMYVREGEKVSVSPSLPRNINTKLKLYQLENIAQTTKVLSIIMKDAIYLHIVAF